ncbi:protransforming growth factor alpha isoform X3 [Heterodontus francisci]|uniref:protransforming growth factor alpha isoform X3 n=1 Tax=Heterodontus francisci TaxID=7792 RepID=UPI00355C1877
MELIVKSFSEAANAFGLSISLKKAEMLDQPLLRGNYNALQLSVDVSNLELFTFTAQKEAIQPIQSRPALRGAILRGSSSPISCLIPVALQLYFLQVPIQFPFEVIDCLCFHHPRGQSPSSCCCPSTFR